MPEWRKNGLYSRCFTQMNKLGGIRIEGGKDVEDIIKVSEMTGLWVTISKVVTRRIAAWAITGVCTSCKSLFGIITDKSREDRMHTSYTAIRCGHHDPLLTGLSQRFQNLTHAGMVKVCNHTPAGSFIGNVLQL
jgi:hypothetical protein